MQLRMEAPYAMDDLLAEFVAETREMLEASEGEIIAWEAHPADRARLDTIFRFVHTVKGNCGFFDFPRLAGLSHAAEDALADCRAGRRVADTALVSAVLAVIDRIAQMVDAIEQGETFPEGGDDALIAALQPRDEPTSAPETGDHAEPSTQEPASVSGGNSTDTEIAEPDTSAANTPRKPDQSANAQRSIRLPVDLLDRVMSGVSDMVLARNDLAHRLRQAGTQPTIDGPFERLTSILSDVRDAITRMRMQRIETLFTSLPRMVRDLSAELGKQVIIDLEGGDVELDREMIETVRDPLTHIIRNAIDHGLEKPSVRLKNGKSETGLLSISARQSGNTISIVVSDDGRGLVEDKIAEKALSTGLIDAQQHRSMTREKILQLIFEPGFSTADKVSTISGRGVGLDVVRENLERVGGSIKVSSTPDVGTMFTLQIPLTLSIIAGLTVEVRNQHFAIPQSYVEEIIHANANALDFTHMGETALVTFRGQRVPCLMLGDVLSLPEASTAIEDSTMVLLRLASGDLFALCVDGIYHHGDLVIKPLSPAVMKSGLYAGATLLDDGQPVLLLDVTNIAGHYDLVSDARTRVRQTDMGEDGGANRAIDRAMLFTDWQGRRCAIRLELTQRIETAPAQAIDLSSGTPRAIIDGVILPVAGLPGGPLPVEKIRLLRLNDGTSELLYAVRDLDDAAELRSALKPVPNDPLIEAVFLIGDTAVSLLNGHEIFARYGEPPQPVQKPICKLPDSDWARAVLRPLIESAGYAIAQDVKSDITILFEEEFEAASELDLLPDGPVIRLRSQQEEPGGGDDAEQSLSIYRYDRDGVLSALKRARNRGAA